MFRKNEDFQDFQEKLRLSVFSGEAKIFKIFRKN
jgi:hypothetical protein